MVARVPGPEERAELRSLVWAARQADEDPLMVLGTYVAMRMLGAERASDLAALLGPGKLRTAQRRRRNLVRLLGMTDLSFCPAADPRGNKHTTDLTPKTTDLSPHSLLSESVDVDIRDTDPGSAGGVEAGPRPPRRGAQNAAARNLAAKGASKGQVREAMAYALEKWPTVKRVREGTLRNQAGFLTTMVVDYALKRGWIDEADAHAGRADHRQGPPCPHCGQSTETGVGRCGNARCAHVTKVVCDPNPRAD